MNVRDFFWINFYKINCTIKFVVEAIDSISDFTVPTYSINIQLAGVEEISIGGTLTIDSVNSLIINAGSYANQTVTYK